ncbi:bifunctional uridylyltransferase/uridylyl-removing protein [Methylomonas lenta]|uniref:Bifunctional uridylyltransferase/uridylyl-removing enzyme n=1 Tax=Methylomonas lenta TaxID=980561 RepID=A0A177NDJ1_9GAMM|nr:[protein-PII] uridylyltransferase [Methylomonas lenta]OAI16128.1 bifunctional uridylyltransferase/uridylyl-removing protein [Methylomonas lenta]
MTELLFSEADLAHVFLDTNPVAVVKQAIIKVNESLKLRFNPNHSPAGLLNEKAQFIDNLLTASWKHFLGDHANKQALIATGGYGRSELFPYSDIDILMLLNQDFSDNIQDRLSGFSNFLWDIGLKPGISTCFVSECVALASQDQTIFTSLLEMRLINGSTQLYSELQQEISASKLWSSERYFLAKMSEQEQRYSKYYDTAYNLEPNIKEGPGGLRDIQVISWVFKHHYNAQSLRELIKYGFLPKSEYDDLVSARDILWRLRFALHSTTNRCEDRLLFDYQRELASLFGFLDHEGNPDVEQFMQFFFKTVVNIERLNEMLLQLLNERLIQNQQHLTPTPITASFSSIAGYLEVSHDEVFQENPLALLELFLLLQQSPSLKGIRASTIRLIRKSLPLIDEDFRQNKAANSLFINILRQPRGITHQLKRMNRYGVLAAYLPDFANIVARMQYDLFHIYTVDEHTLFVIRNLRRFALNRHSQELPFCNNIFLLTPKPDVLYIAALFHDIAKGRGGDHSSLGEKIALNFCKQHDLSRQDSKLIAWLVRNHLLMSMTAQRRDISDPDIIHDFASHVGSIQYLNYLYLLTVADIRATNPSLWNSWKDSLLKDLYIATHRALHRGLQHPVDRSERINDNKKEARRELLKLGIAKKTMTQSWQHLSDDYFLRYSADEIAWHTIAIAASNEDDLPMVLLRPQTQRGSVEIFIFTRDEAQIFSICTATLDHLGLTILDARIITSEDQYVLNSFQVLEQSGEPIADLYREVHICDALRQSLKEKKVRASKNIHKQSRQAKHFPIETSVTFIEDTSNKHTTIELITTDHAGLLSTIGRAFTELGIHLHDAKVTTIGSRAEDMFYISDQNSQPINTEAERQHIRSTLLRYLNSKN